MGRSKDILNVSPVDHYRKQIGKQDYKKSKAELKETKAKSQAKQGALAVYKDIAIMVGSLAAVIGILYTLLYLYLDKKEDVVSTNKI